MNTAWARRAPDTRRKKGTTVVYRQPSEQAVAAQKFAAVILKIPVGKLASAARSSKDAAALWKSARRCPSWPKLALMAQSIPSVRAFVREQTEPGIENGRLYGDTVTMLLALSEQPGEAGAKAKAALHELHGPGA